MRFYTNQIFHIYNQGNNKRQIFFTPNNYGYFLWKMRAYLLPFGDLISWCLMPNHFHWQLYVKEIEISKRQMQEHLNKIEFSRRQQKYGSNAQPPKNRVVKKGENITLNEAIGIIQQSYTKAINKEKKWSGSLFRNPCKAKDGWVSEFITANRKKGQDDSRFQLGNDYAFQCLSYIHNNPVTAGIVTQAVDYPYSSAKEYAGLRNGSLVNMDLGQRIIKRV